MYKAFPPTPLQRALGAHRVLRPLTGEPSSCCCGAGRDGRRSQRQRGSQAANTRDRRRGGLRCNPTFLWPSSSGAKQDGAETTTPTGSTDIILRIYLIGFESCTCSVVVIPDTVIPLVDRARLTVLYTFQAQDHHLHLASHPGFLLPSAFIQQ